MRTTVGQILINQELPPELRDHTRVLDKKGIATLLDALAKRYPDTYADTLEDLHEIGGMAAYLTGHSVSLDDLGSQAMSRDEAAALRREIDRINDSDKTSREKHTEIAELLAEHAEEMETATLKKLRQEGNPLAEEVDSGARGNKTQLNSMVGSSVLVLDHRDNPSPIPVIGNFAEGLTPAEYWARTYGTRKGAVSTKLSTADAGFLAKQLALAAHRLIVSDADLIPGVGLPVDADDPDNEGTVLAKGVGSVPAGTVITASMIKDWPEGTKQILIRSPISDVAPDGGVPQAAAGYRERLAFPDIGENIGIPAVQTITERLSQGSLNVKHTGGVGAAETDGFKVVNQLMQVPQTYPSGAAHASADGRVSAIKDAPQGGKYIEIDDRQYYVEVDQSPLVEIGDYVEAGDVLSDGLPNPAAVTAFKGIGEGRRYFMNTLRKVLDNSGISTNRRNIELLSRALVNHVEITDESDAVPGALPGDVLEYDQLAFRYQPRDDAIDVPVTSARNMHLEKPTLHYSIGTRITPSVQKILRQHEVGRVLAHKDRPPFVPFMQRAMTSLLTTPDWLVRLGGFYVQKGFLESVHRGASADVKGTSYIPGLVFGEQSEQPTGLIG